MYSRYHDRADRPLSIPENYSGCAFSDAGAPSTGVEKTTAPHRIEVAKPTPPDHASDHSPDPPIAPPPPRPILLPPPDLPPERTDVAKSVDGTRASTREESDHAPRERDAQRSNPSAVSEVSAPSASSAPAAPSAPALLDLPTPFRNLFGKMGSAFPFSHGIGFDELLILGLILLLARNESDSDLILWLVLLLFCG